jgi:hypothetical protein
MACFCIAASVDPAGFIQFVDLYIGFCQKNIGGNKPFVVPDYFFQGVDDFVCALGKFFVKKRKCLFVAYTNEPSVLFFGLYELFDSLFDFVCLIPVLFPYIKVP